MAKHEPLTVYKAVFFTSQGVSAVGVCARDERAARRVVEILHMLAGWTVPVSGDVSEG